MYCKWCEDLFCFCLKILLFKKKIKDQFLSKVVFMFSGFYTSFKFFLCIRNATPPLRNLS